MKNILDTVHGHILIPEEYLEKIIDTAEFQRLRRIEITYTLCLSKCKT